MKTEGCGKPVNRFGKTQYLCGSIKNGKEIRLCPKCSHYKRLKK